MTDNELPCVAESTGARPVHAIRPSGLDTFLAGLPVADAAFLRASGFQGKLHELALLPGEAGVRAAVLGLGDSRAPQAFGKLAFALPEGDWRIEAGDHDPADAVLGFCLGAYRFVAFRAAKRPPARLVTGAGVERALSQARGIWMARDLINMPANLLGPAELADAAIALAKRHSAVWSRMEGAALERDYPTVAAVGRGSDRAPVVAMFKWQGSAASDDAPLVSLCGKGVCFDSGGYDLKPSAGMLRMKKDMGGAATVLALSLIHI